MWHSVPIYYFLTNIKTVSITGAFKILLPGICPHCSSNKRITIFLKISITFYTLYIQSYINTNLRNRDFCILERSVPQLLCVMWQTSCYFVTTWSSRQSNRRHACNHWKWYFIMKEFLQLCYLRGIFKLINLPFFLT